MLQAAHQQIRDVLSFAGHGASLLPVVTAGFCPAQVAAHAVSVTVLRGR
jgi:hypothetical protein